MDLRKDINRNTPSIGNFNTQLSTMDRSCKQRINKDIETLNTTVDQMDLIDIHRTFHYKEVKYTFFSNAHGPFSKIDHMTGHKKASTQEN